MAQQKPPKSAGSRTGFPYSVLWEEFGDVWDELGRDSNAIEAYEKLLSERADRALPKRSMPTREAIEALVAELTPDRGDAGELAKTLYRIAAVYWLPKLKLELNQGPAASRKRMESIARAAQKLAELMEQVPLDQEAVLGMFRPIACESPSTPLFDIKALIAELKDLSAASELFASEVPKTGRGTSIDILHARLLEAATAAIGSASNDELKVKQADSAGRNPRPGSKSAEVLFRYLDLVEPGMTDATKVRLFPGFNKGWQSVSLKQIRSDEFPKRWPRHEARAKMTK